MAYYLDYSAAKLSGQTIRNAGYVGVLRYIYAGRESKQTDINEYRSHQAAGLDVYFVCQAGTEDADGGFARGAALARGALAEANTLGYPSDRVIFFTNDRTTLPSPAAWRAFLDGAASVLGRNRVGAYGFANAIDAAVGHAVAFWQAGRRSDVRPFVNFWQDNNTKDTVGGILCDRNLVLNPMPGGVDLDATQATELKVMAGRIAAFLSGTAVVSYGPTAGERLTMVEQLNDEAWRLFSVANMVSEQPAGPSKGSPIPIVGEVKGLKAEVASMKTQLAELNTAVRDAVRDAVSAYLRDNPPAVNVDAAAIAQAVIDENARRLAE